MGQRIIKGKEIHDSFTIDGKYLDLDVVLEETVFYGLALIVSCVPYKLAYFQAEQEQGPPPRYILKRD